MPDDFPQRLIACSHCDLPMEVPALEQRQAACCPRCGAVVAKRFRGGWRRVAAFATISLVALFIALGFSYLSLSGGAGDSSASVVGVAWAMILERPLLGSLVGLFFVGVPALQCVAIFGLSVAFLRGQPSLRWRHVAALIERLGPWCMADVFLVGTLVSLIKIASLAEVTFGASFWGFVFFVVYLVAAYSSLDTKRVISDLHRNAD
ncbi:paraquat-inducible protein A [Pelagicoccus sp. NFK12]|uniref:Paraquat-inducible protein A n=1 Tax=Pelagicoccus enzymogenes TaxID=2773457 RepID=A0A927FCU5_9BACT|nr:paraquat-inducible protein A [Pelagicoccus enzymogenes]MBD5781355.1 paraquat-inducible protein A [Pelagicoccus enzymogenes]